MESSRAAESIERPNRIPDVARLIAHLPEWARDDLAKGPGGESEFSYPEFYAGVYETLRRCAAPAARVLTDWLRWPVEAKPPWMKGGGADKLALHERDERAEAIYRVAGWLG